MGGRGGGRGWGGGGGVGWGGGRGGGEVGGGVGEEGGGGGREGVGGGETTGRSVECKLPGRSQGNVTVEVSLNGEDWVGGGVQFRYRGICVTGAVVPSMGTEEGGTRGVDQERWIDEEARGGVGTQMGLVNEVVETAKYVDGDTR